MSQQSVATPKNQPGPFTGLLVVYAPSTRNIVPIMEVAQSALPHLSLQLATLTGRRDEESPHLAAEWSAAGRSMEESIRLCDWCNVALTVRSPVSGTGWFWVVGMDCWDT